MSRKAQRQVVQALRDGSEVRYRHIAQAVYRPRQYRPDPTWRLVIHADLCPRADDAAATCLCYRVDIRHVAPPTPGD